MSALESESTGGVRLVRRRIGENGCTLLEKLDGVVSTSTLLIETFEAWRRMTFRSSPFGLSAFLPCMIVAILKMTDLLCHIRYTGVSLFLLLICLLDIGPDNKIPHWLYFRLWIRGIQGHLHPSSRHAHW